MNALHETQGQAALWAVFMLSGSFCALLTDLIRLLALPCHANGGEHAPIIPYKNAYGIPLPDFPAAGALCGAVSALIAAGTALPNLLLLTSDPISLALLIADCLQALYLFMVSRRMFINAKYDHQYSIQEVK